MPSLFKRLASLNKKKDRASALIRQSRTLFPRVTNALHPHPTLHLITNPIPSTDPELSLSLLGSCFSQESLHSPLHSPLQSPLQSPLPPSAIPYPPQVCAAPLSTHHRLHCTHTVRTPFLTPCATNCAHIIPNMPLPPFVTDTAFACPLCAEKAVAAAARDKRAVFAAMVARNASVLLEGEWDVMAAAYERIVAAEEEEDRAAAVARLGGSRWCEAAEKSDGHLMGCP